MEKHITIHYFKQAWKCRTIYKKLSSAIDEQKTNTPEYQKLEQDFINAIPHVEVAYLKVDLLELYTQTNPKDRNNNQIYDTQYRNLTIKILKAQQQILNQNEYLSNIQDIATNNKTEIA
jgi:hypothetical protein